MTCGVKRQSGRNKDPWKPPKQATLAGKFPTLMTLVGVGGVREPLRNVFVLLFLSSHTEVTRASEFIFRQIGDGGIGIASKFQGKMATENPAIQGSAKTSSEVKASVLHGVKELRVVSSISCYG